jgi:hypothetical protein
MLFDRSAVNKRQFNPSTGSGLGVDGARMPGASPRVIIKFNPSNLRRGYGRQATSSGLQKTPMSGGILLWQVISLGLTITKTPTYGGV